MADRKRNRPVFTARSGRLSVSVWLNQGQKGDYYQIAPQRAYNVSDQPTASLQGFTRFGSSVSTSSIVSALGSSAKTRWR